MGASMNMENARAAVKENFITDLLANLREWDGKPPE